MPVLGKVTRILTVLFVIHQIFYLPNINYQMPRTAPLALILYLSSFALFWSAFYSNRKRPLPHCFTGTAPQHLVTSGPYQYVRHPFYVSYLLVWIAGAVVLNRAEFWIPVGVMTGLYVYAARKEEQSFLISGLRNAFLIHRKRAGFFLPRLSCLLTKRRT